MKNIKAKMDSATSDMNRMTEDYLKLKSILRSNDAELDRMRKENEKLSMQVTFHPSTYNCPLRKQSVSAANNYRLNI